MLAQPFRRWIESRALSEFRRGDATRAVPQLSLSPHWHDCLSRVTLRAHRGCRLLPQPRALPAGNHAGAWRSGPQQDAPAAALTNRLVRNGVSVQRNFFHRLARRLGRFPNGFRDFFRLAKSAADHSIVVSGHDQRAETKTPPAFHHFRAAIDENNFLSRIAFRRGSSIQVARIGSSSCALLRHELKFQTAFAGRVRQNFDFSVIKKSAAVENDIVDLFREGAFRNGFADRRRR